MLKKIFNNYKIDFDDNNIHIHDSYKCEDPNEMEIIINNIINDEDTSKFIKRKISTYVNEWCTHNLLYNLDYHRDRTASVDFEHPQKILYTIGYFILGNFYKFFH